MLTMAASSRATSLYRSLLRAHKRHLPAKMKQLGDSYVKTEFKLHKHQAKPEQVERFFVEWENYLQQILMTARAQDAVKTAGTLDDKMNGSIFHFGKDLPQEVQQELTEEQAAQLEKLREETRKARKRHLPAKMKQLGVLSK